MCMLTIIPSPRLPLTIAVTTTSVSLVTKFRMHRSFFALCPGCATSSNLRACARSGGGESAANSFMAAGCCCVEKEKERGEGWTRAKLVQQIIGGVLNLWMEERRA